MKKLTISFFGSSLVSAYWNGAATYYRGIIKALHYLGHTVKFYEPDAYERQAHRDIPNPDYARSIVYPPTEEGLRSALDDASGSDIIVKNSGVGVFDEELEREVLKFKKDGAKVIFWDVDAPATLDRIKNDQSDHFLTLVPEYDLILTYGGGEPVIDAYLAAGAKNCIPVYNALDPETHYPAGQREEFECDLALLANRMPDREERVHSFFFHAAHALPDQNFILGGNGWQENSPELDNVKYLGHVYTKDHNALNCSAKAILNLSRDSMASYGFSPATRVFEAAGAGACIITDKWEGIEIFLEPGKECLVVNSGEELTETLRNLTKEQAVSIGKAAYRRVLAAHTYNHRAEQLNNILQSIFAKQEEVV